MNKSGLIRVCAAVIRDNGRILVCTRPAGKHLEGLWEFPGGKTDPGETDEQCLRREIKEELSLDVIVLDQIFSTEYSYPGKTVEIIFYRAFQEEPLQRIHVTEKQEYEWMDVTGLAKLELVPADVGFAEWLASGEGR
ncbi:MAG TPA: hypothetical protein DCZ94_03445 [Lentisphaeria bacterium]|nr:MAG: hypothetical protein A2X48_04105 [Lentisphaerae bacterium GWF2_49_21]HBC85989.1 hypothetical protein [Lentisphaeria bacterium]